MRHFIIILLFIPTVLHAQMSKRKTSSVFQSSLLNENKFQINGFGFNGPKHLDTLFYDNNQIKAIGYYAIDKQGNNSSHRVGLWTEYYRNGQIMSIGSYDLQFYYGCYNTMPGIRYYSFKKGDWSYYYENGQTKAKGSYKVERVQISTGVANQFESKSSTTGDWIINDEDGQPAKDKQEIISDLDRLRL
jgi:antitoxin component YwqK of YwqJK toxin-antitoxin module